MSILSFGLCVLTLEYNRLANGMYLHPHYGGGDVHIIFFAFVGEEDDGEH